MVGSIWRYSHFLLAIISALFLVIASITGAILAIEPIKTSTQPYAAVDIHRVSLAKTLSVLQKQYVEVLDLEVTPENFVTTNVITVNGDAKTIYINPLNGDNLGNVQPRSPFYTMITNLHRSLFLKSIGRAFVGVFSILLCFIAGTGVFLLAQRQGGFKKWFTKVQEKDNKQRYHVILGRWFLIPILIIASTGIYLSAEKFDLLPKHHINHNWDITPEISLKQIPVSEFTVFKKLFLNSVKKVNFPFSSDPEDYFEIALNDKELLVHQYTGKILSEVDYPFITLASRFSMQLHTGEGQILWSVVLLLASISLLYFIYSGFAIRLKKSKQSKEIINKHNKDDAEYILLVGSESKSTYAFAKLYADALEKANKKIYTASLNEYTSYQKASHLIVFTATYGDGDAPSNARKFESLFSALNPIQKLQFSVVGFGSEDYPKFCEFAIKVDSLLHEHSQFNAVLPLVKINEQSKDAFKEWLQQWNSTTGMSLDISKTKKKTLKNKEQTFKVVNRTELNQDNTAILRLRPEGKTKFNSGDLLQVIPPEASKARAYSIARINNDILLSIKWHPKGLCSTYLCTLLEGNVLKAKVEKNKNFHFPKKAPEVWFISNGTGIAPFLGMVNTHSKRDIQLIWGGKSEASFNYYQEVIEEPIARNKNINLQFAFSQTASKMYVQDVLKLQKTTIAKALTNGAVFMLCGSLAMQNEVLDVLEEITSTYLNRPLSDFENQQQILMDCY